MGFSGMIWDSIGTWDFLGSDSNFEKDHQYLIFGIDMGFSMTFYYRISENLISSQKVL